MQERRAHPGCFRARPTPADPDHADADLLRRTAAWLRAHLEQGRCAGLPCDDDTATLAALLEVLAVEVAYLDPELRRRAVASCREALGEGPCSQRVARRSRIHFR